jgi:uncharacterized RDD family membrane protein YckC
LYSLHLVLQPLTIMIIAPLWRRLAAMLYDSILLISIWIVLSFLVTAAFGIEESRHVENGTTVLEPLYQTALFGTVIVSGYLFFGWFWTHSGQTLGMQAWKIKAQNTDGSALNWRQVLLRYLTAPIALAMLGLGYWWMLVDPAQRTWSDWVSNSIIVKIDNFPAQRSR